MDDQLVTPEAVVLDLDTAAVPTRAAAAVVDVVLQLLVFVAVALGAVASGADGAGAPEVVVTVGASLLAFLTQLVYPTVMEARYGATLGQMLLGLRVVSAEGGQPSFRMAATRTAVGLLELEATLGLLALVTASVDRRGRRLGDVAAGTLVVRTRVGERAEVLAPQVPPRLRSWADGLDTARFGQPERAALRRYVQRRGDLAPQVRADLAAQVAGRLVPLAGARPPAGASPDEALVALAAVVGRAAQRAGTGSAPPPPPPLRADAPRGAQGERPPAPAAEPTDATQGGPSGAPRGGPTTPQGGDGGFAPPA